MSAATLLLVVNLFVAAVLSTSFVVVSHLSTMQRKSSRGARWTALAFGILVIHAALQLVQPYLVTAEPVNFVVFIAFLAAEMAITIGLAQHLRIQTPWWRLGMLAILAFASYAILLGLPREVPVAPFLYQAPIILALVLAGSVVLKGHRRSAIDFVLLAALALSAVTFAGKAYLGMIIGTGRDTQSYVASAYGAYSQTLQAFFLISIGLLLLFAMSWDLLVELVKRSETDKLSGVLNRHGFELQVERSLVEAVRVGRTSTMIVADIDQFKHINDTFGHSTGDRVIASFARLLTMEADTKAIVGRIGGEEFAVFLDGGIVEGRAYAECVRSRITEATVDFAAKNEQFTASFGVAELQHAESPSDALHRADGALYEAKMSGRDCVRVAHNLSLVGSRDSTDIPARQTGIYRRSRLRLPRG